MIDFSTVRRFRRLWKAMRSWFTGARGNEFNCRRRAVGEITPIPFDEPSEEEQELQARRVRQGLVPSSMASLDRLPPRPWKSVDLSFMYI